MDTPCPNKEVCGSCGWSHIPYPKQLEQKLSDINGSFALKELDVTCTEILPSPETTHYRNRMDFVIDFEGRVGMRQKGKWWRVIDDHTCFLSDEKIEEHFATVREWTKTAGLSFYDRKSHEGFLRYAVIRSTTIGETMITIVTSEPENSEKAKTALLNLAEKANPTTLIWAVNHTDSDVSYGDDLSTITGPGYITETLNDISYQITPNAFFQTNPHGAKVLMDTVLEFAGDVSEKVVLDLYCGSGFFALPFSRTAKETIGVELVPDAIRDAKANAELNTLDVAFHEAPTENYDWSTFNPDVVILDPPRAGMHDKALEDVMHNKPETIIYVSCNYKNFARELVQLQTLYEIENMRAIDMFPHTPHVELVTKLNRK